MRALGEEKIRLILTFPLPKTLKQIRAFFGVTGYCRIWMLEYADLARPSYQILKEAQKDPHPFIKWDKSDSAFHQLKKVLMPAPDLGLPVQVTLQLYVYEKGRLTQLWGIIPKTVGYLSKKLDQVAKGWPDVFKQLLQITLQVPEAQKLVP
jgi:hypothetical protein